MTMVDESQDLFGKIDAMFGKRAGFAAGMPKPDDEFPLLTDVVTETIPDRSVADAMTHPDAVPMPEPAGGALLSEVDIDRLAAALEARLSELFIRQQLRIEALVRRVVREELDRRD
jgi:hypothetical protein